MVNSRRILTISLAIFAFAAVAQSSSQQSEEAAEAHPENMTEGAHGEERRCKSEEVEEGEFESSVVLAKVEFERVETIFVVLVFIMIVVLAKMSESLVYSFINWCRSCCLIDCMCGSF